MEELLVRYGGVIGVFAFLVVSWWRSRNDAKNAKVAAVNAQSTQIQVLSTSLDTALQSLMAAHKRLETIEAERSIEREATNQHRIAQQNQIEALEDAQRKIKAENEEMCHELTEQIGTLQTELSQERKLREQGEAEIKRLQARIAQLENERAALIGNNAQVARERDELAERVAKLERQIQVLQKTGTGPLAEAAQEPGESTDRNKQSEE